MKYLSIDIETTGLDPEKHQILEFAAVLDDLENPQPLNELPTFHRSIRWDDYTISDYCLRLHKELLDDILNGSCNITIDELGSQFKQWLEGLGIGENYNVAGANFAGFDGAFLKKVLNFPPWFYRVIDVGSMFLRKDADRLPGLSDIDCLATGHRALPDAMSVVGAIHRKFWPCSYPNEGK